MTGASNPRPTGLRLFRPILAGATLRERTLALVGVMLSLGLTGVLSALMLGSGAPLLAGPMGAVALLLFIVPTSPLAQPWPVIGGNLLSALVGAGVAHLVADPALAAPLAVGLAILAMSLTRSMHPPGGATALVAVLATPADPFAWSFGLLPIAVNAVLLVLLATIFHRLNGRSYPHRAVPPPVNPHATADALPELRTGFTPGDVDSALSALGETFDIDRDDLDRILRQVEAESLRRLYAGLRVENIMSRDVIGLTSDQPGTAAVELLLRHNLRTLPVTSASGELLGTVGLREVIGHETEPVGARLSPPLTAAPAQLVVDVMARLTDGRRHAVVITDTERRVLGLVTQTDLLAALTRRAI